MTSGVMKAFYIQVLERVPNWVFNRRPAHEPIPTTSEVVDEATRAVELAALIKAARRRRTFSQRLSTWLPWKQWRYRISRQLWAFRNGRELWGRAALGTSVVPTPSQKLGTELLKHVKPTQHQESAEQ